MKISSWAIKCILSIWNIICMHLLASKKELLMMISSRLISIYIESTEQERLFNINNMWMLSVPIMKWWKVFVEIAMKSISIFSVLTCYKVIVRVIGRIICMCVWLEHKSWGISLTPFFQTGRNSVILTFYFIEKTIFHKLCVYVLIVPCFFPYIIYVAFIRQMEFLVLLRVSARH